MQWNLIPIYHSPVRTLDGMFTILSSSHSAFFISVRSKAEHGGILYIKV
ncbi:MAG: hypothetical protein NC041_00485 [Bacteroides sp.]|nr:hypothetical protein [Prevotella sp.]MCM1408580.1 hypothetical protein [Treponema brennaborense]MCM1468931.1 hypothetical protein [Bacteroides sp.]